MKKNEPIIQRDIYLLSPLKKEGTIFLPMITFSLLTQNIELSKCDMLMFTSKQAVLSAESINPLWKEIPCLAIGDATAKQIESLGGTVYHKPKIFYAKSLSDDIIKKFKDKNITYLRPKEVSFDSKHFLAQENILLNEQVIYETTCISYEKKYAPQKNAIIIFTSPSTVKCFFNNFSWDKSYIAIVIGEATKKHLQEEVHMYVADVATIEACILKAKEFLTANRL